MITENTQWFTAVGCLQHHQRAAFKAAERLHGVIKSLSYEGKGAFKRNLKEAKRAIKFLNEGWLKHMKVEGDIVSRFLLAHVPRLEPVLRVMSSDHDELMAYMKGISRLLTQLERTEHASEREELIREIKERETYQYYFLDHHMRAESAILHRAIDQDLKAEEKRQIEARLTTWISRKG